VTKTIKGMGIIAAMLSAAALFVACGGSAPGGAPGSGIGGSGGGSQPTSGAMTLSLVDSSGAPISVVAPGSPVRAEAVLTANGSPLANEIVKFSVADSQLVGFDPSSGAVLTDAAGVARVSVTASGSGNGATTLTATATVGGTDATATRNFSVGQGSATGLILSAFDVSVGAGGLSSYGTAAVSATVTQANGQPPATPVTVAFTSSCPAGKATLTTTATTGPSGVAQATFTDNGCAATVALDVTLTASTSSASRSQTFKLNPPSAGSLRFVSANPSDRSITLKGQGGAGRQEFATLTFRLVDVAGNGVPDTDVCIDATTYVGGLNIDGFNSTTPPPVPGSDALCGTDNTLKHVKRSGGDGTLTVQVNSGTTPTPVRVRARAIYPAGSSTRLETVSDSLSISTGLPIDRAMDLSVDKANIDGWDISGETANFTVRLADQFGNPVPDGTVVNFITSGGAICTANTGSCTTVNGSCTCPLVTQAPRPADGRVVVLAYAVGLEDYVDSNGDNAHTAGESFTDLGDAFLDANKDGLFGDDVGVNPSNVTINGETDVPLAYQTPPIFKKTGNGVRDTAHIRRQGIIYFSGSSGHDPTILVGTQPILFPAGNPCPAATTRNVAFILEDGRGNPMATGTTLTATSTTPDFAVSNMFPAAVAAFGARAPIPAIDFGSQPKATNSPQLVGTGHSVTITSGTTNCAVGTKGLIRIEVKSPKGAASAARVLIPGQARTFPRFGIEVEYQ
jgi:hypothetical protein